jgi:cytochrome P450
MAKQAPSVHGQVLFHFLALEYPDIQAAGAVYVDLWPISSPTLATFHPQLVSQYTQDQSMLKHSALFMEFNDMTGMKDLVCSEGALWKKWRAAYNPGFSSQNVMALVPSFVQEALVWKKYLMEVADKDETIKLEDRLMQATCDIISVSVL